ncbi:MAG TPA: hypothetical protein VFK06_00865 [Candidatus Angelobacter sp.]|nr:hypothetical protein [Candidatus Angelobacter sp.]
MMTLAAQQGTLANSQALVEGVKTGDKYSILAAGNTGDVHYVPYLRHLLAAKQTSLDVRLAARMALAKLGQQDQLRYVLCATKSKQQQVDVDVVNYLQSDAIEKALPYIGGGVRGL